MSWWSNPNRVAQRRRMEGLHSTGSDLDRKFWPAMAVYAILAGLAWFTLGEGKVLIQGRLIEVRWVPMFVIAMFVFRTIMAREADKIRHRGR